MKGRRELFIFIIVGVLFTSTLTYAAIDWGSMFLKASKTVVTSSGNPAVIGATYKLTEQVAAAMVKKAAMLEAAAMIANPIVTASVVAIGAYWMYTDLSDLVSWLQGQLDGDFFEPGYTTGTVQWYIPGTSVYMRVQPYGNWNAQSNPMSAYSKIKVKYNNSGVTGVTRSGSAPITNWGQYCQLCVNRNGDITACYGNFNPSSGWQVETEYTGPNQGSENRTGFPTPIYKEAAAAQALHNNPQAVADALAGKSTISSTAPSGSGSSAPQEYPGATGSVYENPFEDPDTGELTDPDTGLNQDPVEDPNADPNAQPDPFVTPGMPTKPSVDTTIEPPEGKDIETLIGGWLENAPFVSIIKNFEVESSGGQCSFTISLPFGGGSATIDFCEFSDLWAMIAAIVISFSYIYGMMIIFGGKS